MLKHYNLCTIWFFLHEDTFDACYMVIFYAQNVKPQTIIHCERTRGEKQLEKERKRN